MPTAQSSAPVAFAWAVLPPNPDLEAEMLSRLMQRFGTPAPVAQTAVASSTPPPPGQPTPTDAARIEKGADGATRLVIEDAFDRAWRRVGLALDRVGFTVEDRDRSNGLYFVRYIDPEVDNKQSKGWLSKLKFWGNDEAKKNERYRIQVKENPAGTEVSVLNKEGAREQSETGKRILALLYEQLK
jgi:outer membrane protein assembly factor BamC